MDNIHYNFKNVEIPDFDPEFFDLWLLKVVKEHVRTIDELNFIFCDDEELLKINQKYLGHDYFTDVITFNYNDKNSLAGDIFISYDRVIQNSADFGNGSVFDELCRVMVHGVLHLLGFDDKTETDKAAMKVEEDKCLQKR